MHSAKSTLGLDLQVVVTPRTKASVDVAGAGGVGARAGGTEAMVAGADDVALVSITGTAADL